MLACCCDASERTPGNCGEGAERIEIREDVEKYLWRERFEGAHGVSWVGSRANELTVVGGMQLFVGRASELKR